MKKVRSVKPQETKFSRVYELQVGNFSFVQADINRIQGERRS
jgi:hypothetical protein